MSKRILLEGKKFGKLFVKEYLGSKKYLCICECGIEEVKTYGGLVYDGVISCRTCTNEKLSIQRRENLDGKRFGRLTVICHHKNDRSRCLCDCGKEKIINNYHLKSGNTESCGCLMREVSKKMMTKMASLKAIQDPITASAKRVFSFYNKDGLSFEKFIELSRLNCYYCKISPNNASNAAKYGFENNKISYKRYPTDQYNFVYNGLDRVDSSLGHVEGNLVPCCKRCNWAKLNFSSDSFLNHMKKLVICNIGDKMFPKYKLEVSELVKEMSKLSALKKLWKRIYSDGISFENFLKISQHPCFYCGDIGYNKVKFRGVEYSYNGLDRVDSKRGHDLDNVVACCKRCNTAKSDMSLTEFCEWIGRFSYLV